MNKNESPDPQPAPSPAPADWRQRAEQFQEQEWALAQQLLALGRRSLLNYLGQLKATTSLAQVEKILRLAHKIGQISSQLAAAKADSDSECPKCCASRLEREAALAKVYGKPIPGEETTVQTSSPSDTANGSRPSTPNPQPSAN